MDTTTAQINTTNKVNVVNPKKRTIVSRKVVANTVRPKVVKSVKGTGCNSCAARKMARAQLAQTVQAHQ